MNEPRQWIISTKLVVEEQRMYVFSVGEEISVEIVVTCHDLQEAITNVNNHVKECGFRLIDILNCEIMETRTFHRKDRTIFLSILNACTHSRHNAPDPRFAKFVDSSYIAKMPKPWIVTTHVKALPSWDGEMPYEEAVYINDCLLYAVTEECAKLLVADSMLSMDFEIVEYIRCEIFDDTTTEPTYEKSKTYGGDDIVVNTLHNYIDHFIKTGELTFGNFIFPEERA